MKTQLSKLFILAISFQFLAASISNAQTGTWTIIPTLPSGFNCGVSVLLTDGTVIVHNQNGGAGGTGKGWDKLTPNSSGSYINGTWSSIASMNNDRLYFATQMLNDGRVFAAGAEYSNASGSTTGEVYNPVANTWTATNAVTNGANIYDGNSEILANGNVLVGPQIGANPSFDCMFYNPTTNNWSAAPIAPLNHDEAQWVKLPDGSILFVGINSTNSCRYIPSTNTWVADATVPVSLYDTYGEEAGAGLMLPNGKVIFFGATGHNAIYNPSGTSSPGTWAVAADFPTIGGNLMAQDDAPAAMMTNGKILCAVSPVPIGTGSGEFRKPTYFVEYDYTNNTFAQVTGVIPGFGSADSISTVGCYSTNLLDLPNGQVLLTIQGYKNCWVYTPGSAAISAGKPTIEKIIPGTCPSYKLVGKLFNGISEGAAYGDDWQAETNYPIVRLTNGTNVYYAKTTYWNRIGAVRTDSLEDTVTFTPPTLPAGTYSLVVTANGFASNPILFTTLGITIASKVNNSCDLGTGSITANAATGGVGPYTYSWSPSGGTNLTASNLTANTYTVTVTDGSGCTATASASITQPASALGITISTHTNVNCNGNNTGSATANAATGGTSPYTYAWSPSGGSTISATNLTANTYSITAIDNTGCSASASVAVTQPASGLGISITSHTNVNCTGNNTGSATASATMGGTSPYTYAWTPSGGTGLNATNLAANTYTITVTDAHSCSASASVAITQPTALTTTASVTANVGCNGSSTGNATANPSNGTTPYTYAWSNGTSTVSTSNPTGAVLPAGGYTVTVSDICGESQTASVNITQPVALATTISVSANVNCNGGTTGNANATPSGGNLPYTYSWSNGSTTVSTSNPTGAILSAGSYTLTVRDNCGASKTASAVITQPTALATTASVIANVGCATNGNASAAPSGGNIPYTYAWSNGSTTVSTSNPTGAVLTAGSYTVTVRDNCGASKTAAVTITSPGVLSATASVIANVSCTSSGNASASPSGGTGPFTYSWSNGTSTVSTSNPTGAVLSVGNYTVTVTDNCSHTTTASINITQVGAVVASWWSHYDVSCFGGSNGKAISTVYGGTLPYTYSWSNGQTTGTGSNLSAGSYTLTVTDKNGCFSIISTTVTQPASALTETTTKVSDLTCNGNKSGSATANPSGGTSPYTFAWVPSGGTIQTSVTLPAGTDNCKVTDSHGCIATASVTLTQPAIIFATFTKTIPLCNGASNGVITATGTGGSGNYTAYSWAPYGGSSSMANNLSAQTYTVTITDNAGCIGTANVSLGQPAIVAVTIPSFTCVVGGKGTVTANATGGTAAYHYVWSNGTSTVGTAKTVTLPNGSYTVTVGDSHNCPGASASTTISGCPDILPRNGMNNGGANGDGFTEISIYPNPTTGHFTLSGLEAGMVVEVYDYIGKKITTITSSDISIEINLTKQSDGVYLIRILNKDGKLVGQKKLVKTN